MNIVILDGHTMNPGDLRWDPLRSLGDLTVYDRTPAEMTIPRAANAEIILTNKVVLGAAEIAALPCLRYIGVLATGYNVVDLAAAYRHGILVTNVPAYSTPSAVQMVFAHLFNLTFGLAEHMRGVRDGRWQNSPDFCYWDRPLFELAGSTMGIVGYGRIGRAVAQAALPFGMSVIVHTRSNPESIDPSIRLVSLDELFVKSDIISLHCPLTEQTRHLVNRERLDMMKSTAYIINTGRGPLIDEQALADALNSGRIAGAGLDVLSTEPPKADTPLLKAENCHITPHIAWATVQSRQRLFHVVVENIRAFLAGKPQNIVTI